MKRTMTKSSLQGSFNFFSGHKIFYGVCHCCCLPPNALLSAALKYIFLMKNNRGEMRNYGLFCAQSES